MEMEMPMSTTEQEPVCSDNSLDCPGCIERDLEIDRLLESNHKLQASKLSLKTAGFLFVGWLIMTAATFGLVILCCKASASTTWVQYLSTGTLLSTIIVQFGLAAALLIVHDGTRLNRVIIGFFSTLGMIVAWFLISTLQSDIENILEELTDAVYLLPPAMVICLVPMFLMKLFARWKLVPRGNGDCVGAPSISSILSMTTICAVGVTCLTKIDAEAYLGSGSKAETTLFFLYYLALPSLTVGTTLAASCFCAMGQGRSNPKVAISCTAIAFLFAVLAPAFVAGFAYWGLEEEAVDQDFLKLMFFSSLGPLIVGTFFGLFAAFWLRFAGYELRTQGGPFTAQR